MNSVALQKAREITSETRAMYPDIPWVASERLVEMQSDKEANFVLVDIRTTVEMNWSVIPGSVPLKVFEKDLLKDMEKDTMVVVHCTWAFRSGYEARRLRNRYGLTNVSHLDGIVTYAHEPKSILIDPSTKEESKFVHTIRKDWSFQPDGYVAKYFTGLDYIFAIALTLMTKLLRDVQNWIHLKRHGNPSTLKKD